MTFRRSQLYIKSQSLTRTPPTEMTFHPHPLSLKPLPRPRICLVTRYLDRTGWISQGLPLGIMTQVRWQGMLAVFARRPEDLSLTTLRPPYNGGRTRNTLQPNSQRTPPVLPLGTGRWGTPGCVPFLDSCARIRPLACRGERDLHRWV